MKSECKCNPAILLLFLWLLIIVGLVLNQTYNIVTINYDLSSIVISNTVVIIIFAITYFLIDRRNIKANENKRKVARAVIIDSYDKCLGTITMMDNDWSRNNIASKVNGNIPINEERVLLQIHNYPFLNDGMVQQFATDGVLLFEEFEDYLKIKNDHWSYVSSSVTFYDYYNSHEWIKKSKESLKADIENAKSRLNKSRG